MRRKTTFDVLLLLARPAAGKSEIIHYLENTPGTAREKRFHIGRLAEIDDFPMLWTWFEEDDLLEKMGHPRLHSDADGYFLERYFWDLLIERMNLEYRRLQRDIPDFLRTTTTLIEFSRGSEHGGYASAFAHLSAEVLSRAAVLYIDVPWEESLRKNRRRANPDKPDSILEHSLPDEKLERLYRETDWTEVSRDDPSFLHIQGFKVPYRVFDNRDDVTTAQGQELGARLQDALENLWKLYRSE
jgi:hypothetical protein